MKLILIVLALTIYAPLELSRFIIAYYQDGSVIPPVPYLIELGGIWFAYVVAFVAMWVWR